MFKMTQMYKIVPSPRSEKKWRVITPSGKKIDFGQDGASDYTIHKDAERKQRYINRHAGDDSGLTSRRENWSKSGTATAGFWSRWLTWNLPDFIDSVRDIEKRFGITIDTSVIKKNSDGSPINGSSTLPTTSSAPSVLSTPLSADPLDENYRSCIEEAKGRTDLKLCPEGYCTVKLTEDVYPSYWANLKASKICSGEEMDMLGNYVI